MHDYFGKAVTVLYSGVFKDAGSFLSDANRVFDNRIYQNFSYQIETERPQSEWNDYVKAETLHTPLDLVYSVIYRSNSLLTCQELHG